MKLLILLITISTIGCVTKTKPNLIVNMPNASLELNEQGIPVECYDTEGNFDSNRGHDYLDCGNLNNRVKF